MEGEMEGDDTIATTDGNIIYDDEGGDATDDITTDPFADLDDHRKFTVVDMILILILISTFFFDIHIVYFQVSP